MMRDGQFRGSSCDSPPSFGSDLEPGVRWPRRISRGGGAADPVRGRDDSSPTDRSSLSREGIGGIGPVRRSPRTGGGHVRRPLGRSRRRGCELEGRLLQRDPTGNPGCPAPVRAVSRKGPGRTASIWVSISFELGARWPGVATPSHSAALKGWAGSLERLAMAMAWEPTRHASVLLKPHARGMPVSQRACCGCSGRP